MNSIDFTLQTIEEPKQFFDAESRLGEPVVFLSRGQTEEVPDQYTDTGKTQVVVADYVVTLSPESGKHHVEQDVYVRQTRLRYAILAAVDKAQGDLGVVGGYLVRDGNPFELRPFPPERLSEVSQVLQSMWSSGAMVQSDWEYGFPNPDIFPSATEVSVPHTSVEFYPLEADDEH